MVKYLISIGANKNEISKITGLTRSQIDYKLKLCPITDEEREEYEKLWKISQTLVITRIKA